VISTILRQNN